MDREKAINIVRKNIPHLGIGSTEMTEALKELIPELRESEDERIRINLISFLEALYAKGKSAWDEKKWGKSDCVDWINYLDRVKEKHPLEDFSRGYNEGYYHGVTDKEKKPVMPKDFGVAKDNCKGAHLVLGGKKPDYSGLNDFERAIHRGFLCAGVENVPRTIIKETAQDCLAQQKAEWSIEDKACQDTILCAVQGKFVTEAALKQAISWLKSLGPIKPVEWSEEDTLMLTAIIQTLERFGGRGTTGMQIDWLKSLRPQPKPSWSEEDQLNLNWVIAILNGEPCDLDIQLESLISWLKSLRPDSYKNSRTGRK